MIQPECLTNSNQQVYKTFFIDAQTDQSIYQCDNITKTNKKDVTLEKRLQQNQQYYDRNIETISNNDDLQFLKLKNKFQTENKLVNNNKNKQPIIECDQYKQSINAQILLRQGQSKKILNKLSLRQRFGFLVPSQMRLKLGDSHKKLIQKMICIDRCIKISNNGHFQSISIKTIKKQLHLMKQFFEDNDLKQIIFLNESNKLYQMHWLKRKDCFQDYDFVIGISKQQNENEKQRNVLFRNTICQFLKIKYLQYLKQKSIDTSNFNFQINQWNYGFDPEDCKIPLSNIPAHPLEIDLQINQNSNSNNNLKSIIKDITGILENQNYKKNKDIKNQSNFKQNIYAKLKQKEQQFKLCKKIEMQQQDLQFNSKQLIIFCNKISKLFTKKNVNTMFLVMVLDTLKKLQKDRSLQYYQSILEHILTLPVKLLIKIQTTKGTLIQIKQENLDKLLNYLQSI